MSREMLSMLMKEEEVSWKQMLYDAVEAGNMDPWDINVTLLTQEYINLIKHLQEHNLRISGKVLLAAAILLKIKSTHFVDIDISNLSRMMNPIEDLEEDLLEGFDEVTKIAREKQQFQLIPKNPQPRNRKVSIHDLVEALQRAMASKKQILARQRPVKFNFPDRKIDIMEAIQDTYHKITYYISKDKAKKLPFARLLPPKAGKQEKVYTFVPLLHLENQQKVETEQAEPFSEIFVKLFSKKKGATETN